MIHKIFCIYDAKVETYSQPFLSHHTGQAIRNFEATVNSEESNLNRHPADFTFYEIGTYDDATGKTQNLQAHVDLGTALQYLKKPSETIPMNLKRPEASLGQKVGA